MRDSRFTLLLSTTALAAANHFALMARVGEECERRYGCSYSDVDADGIIDVLDITGGDKFTESEFSMHMKDAGVDRID